MTAALFKARCVWHILFMSRVPAMWLLCALAIGCNAPGTCSSSTARPAPSATAAAPHPPAASASSRQTSSEIEQPPEAEPRALASSFEAAEHTWRFQDASLGEMVVVVHVPKTSERLPVLIAMHGLGEAKKGPTRGARGWTDDYALPRALRRLAAPPLERSDLEWLATGDRIALLNQSLQRRPYRGMVIATPFTPNILAGEGSLDAAESLARFLVEELLPKLHDETPAKRAPSATGLDGVSLGGRAALLVGLARPSSFGAVAALQAAVYGHELDELTRRARKAREENPNLQLRLLTSSGDFYRATLEDLADRWERAGIERRLDVVRGPHSYAFNRGPGVYEMLLFHDRALRGEAYLSP